ncbi:hypothetical protein YPPY103_2068, partial [Yersinia pestis PY-103]
MWTKSLLNFNRPSLFSFLFILAMSSINI